jgi:hypothetical protein
MRDFLNSHRFSNNKGEKCMRFALTALIWLTMVGGLNLYIQQRDRRLPPAMPAPVAEAAPMEEYTLEITLTFSPQPDPFALQSDPAAAAALVVRLGKRELFRSEQALSAGRPLVVHPVAGLVVGRNELYLRASPPASEALLDHAVRVRLRQGNRELFDQTLWGVSGANVAGTIPFTLEKHVEGGHDH